MYATIDIESTGLNRYTDEITYIGIGLSHSLEDAKFFKAWTLDMSKETNKDKLLSIIKKLKSHKAKCIWQNGKFDTLFIEWKYGKDFKLPISEDIMLMGTAYDLAAEHGLKKMARAYLGVEDWDINKKEKLGKATNFRDTLVPYLKKDVKYTWQLFQFFSNKLSETQWKLYKKLLKPAYKMYADAERTGIYLDQEQFKVIQKKYKDEEARLLKELKSHYDINWNSPQQKAQALFLDPNGEQLPIINKTPKGAPSADAGSLKRLAADGYEIPNLMLEYSGISTRNKMFLNRWGEDSSYDGRLHPCFNLTNVVSGRTSCTNPNLQQVPRTLDIRSLFHAPEGKCFFEADYSQLELRIAAHYANEPTMLRIYREDGDIHTETAKLMTGGREPTKDERRKAKAVNFGFLYGMGAKKFVDYAFDSYGVTFTLPEAQKFRELFFAKYSRLLPWHDEQRHIAEALGGVPNLFGRFRKLPKIYADNWKDKGEAERRSINTPVQGSGSDILLSAAIEVKKTLEPYGLKIVGTVHDSILGEFPEENKDFIVSEIRRIMKHPALLDEFGIELRCPLDCDIGVGPWGTH